MQSDKKRRFGVREGLRVFKKKEGEKIEKEEKREKKIPAKPSPYSSHRNWEEPSQRIFSFSLDFPAVSSGVSPLFICLSVKHLLNLNLKSPPSLYYFLPFDSEKILLDRLSSLASPDLSSFPCIAFLPLYLDIFFSSPKFLIASTIDDFLRSCPSFRAHGAYRGRARQSGDKETRLRVCSLNVGTLNARLLELSDVLNNRKIDFACIQETRWKGARAREGNGYKLWYSGVDNARNGVGILVSSRLKENVVEVCRYRDRIMMIKVIIEEEVVNVLSVYAPHVGLGEGEKRCFWDQLDDVLRSIPEDQRVFIGGDFNGHIGSATDGYDGVHGGFGYGRRNDEGRTLLEFATAHDLVITNSLFNKRDANLITFHSGGHCTQIDYILVRNRDRWACIDCKVSPEEACASQHKLLVLVFRVPHGRNTHRRAKLGKPRILWKKLNGATADDFRSKVLSNTGFGTTNSNNADLLWKNMANSIREVGKNTLGLSTGKAKEHKESWWWNDEVQTKVKTKQTCFKEFLQSNDDEERSRAKQRYKEAKREAKKTVAKAKDKAYEEMYKRLDTKEGQNGIFRLAKSRENRKKDLGSIRFIKDNNGVLIAKDHDIKRVWGNYFFDLFNDGASPCRESTVDGSSDHHTSANDCPTSRIGFEEVKMALRKMGRDKAVGPDQIPITVWLALGEEGVKWLTNIFNIILETAKMPEEWRESTVIPIYKNKGDPQRCGNYRGIKLLSHTMKLWERVIEARLRQVTKVSENKFGFMPGRSTTEAIHLLRRLMEKYREKSRDLHMAFIDLEKAYDSVPRDTIWKTLETRRIPTIYIRTIRDMYCRSTTYVRTTVGDTEAFPVEIGLHQGSALSPYIFALIMDDIFCATPDGVPWCMLFADDIVLVAETKYELNSRLATWKTALEEKGLRINIDKTEYLCSNFSRDQNEDDVEVCIEGHVLPSKDCFKYLGSMIHKDRGVDDDVTHRIKAGWLKWRAATGVLCDKKVPLKLKGKFYRMAIRPALLYGSECWATKKDHDVLGVVPVSEKLREGRLRWFGHVLRRLPSDVVRRVESITVDGARRRGRPRRKWEDCLRSDLMDLALTEDMTSDRKVMLLKPKSKLKSSQTISSCNWTSSLSSVRVETGIEQGDVVSMHYDPMIAKLVVWGENRAAALVKLKDYLSKFQVAGVPTNINFLQKLANNKAFEEGNVETHFIEHHKDDLFVDPNNKVSYEEAYNAARFGAKLVDACLCDKEHSALKESHSGDPSLLTIWYSHPPFRVNYHAKSTIELECIYRLEKTVTTPWQSKHQIRATIILELRPMGITAFFDLPTQSELKFCSDLWLIMWDLVLPVMDPWFFKPTYLQSCNLLKDSINCENNLRNSEGTGVPLQMYGIPFRTMSDLVPKSKQPSISGMTGMRRTGQIKHIHIWHGPHHHHFRQKLGLELADEDETQHKTSFEYTSHPPGTVVAPMAGLVVKLVVKATSAGFVEGLKVSAGQHASDGSVLFRVEGSGDDGHVHSYCLILQLYPL
ncbi:Methylcrotonoyl-CoA carboxylase subunit alpha [Hibiscus syriacus]|uniref:Methylcrotonoyl-CoA carboxylase subunit alpha n=1 Tax=Hibiscus syriacus TaxID=106335 RepID=A0A6A2ZYJ5_HIBSY|nr:Methylcrotonoyl-CoA carboxylase subunit alpha [Hibiscus syriacus]